MAHVTINGESGNIYARWTPDEKLSLFQRALATGGGVEDRANPPELSAEEWEQFRQEDDAEDQVLNRA